MNNKEKGALFGALIGDALALGPHWIYDTAAIAKHFKDLANYSAPLADYHAGKTAGDYTHYGDQAYHLYQYLKGNPQASAEQYADAWRSYVSTANIYMDHATKDSMARLTNGFTGAESDDLGGIAITIPALLSNRHNRAQYLAFLHLTHNDDLLDCVAAFSRAWLTAIMAGEDLKTSGIRLLKDYPTLQSTITFDVTDTTHSDVKSIADIGQACPVQQSFPASLYLIFKYDDDFSSAMKANVAAGGDSAARGMYIGMILGASIGYASLPQALVADLNQKPD